MMTGTKILYDLMSDFWEVSSETLYCAGYYPAIGSLCKKGDLDVATANHGIWAASRMGTVYGTEVPKSG